MFGFRSFVSALEWVFREVFEEFFDFTEEAVRRFFGGSFFDLFGARCFLESVIYYGAGEGEFKGWEFCFRVGILPLRVWVVDQIKDFKKNWRWFFWKGLKFEPEFQKVGSASRPALRVIGGLFDFGRKLAVLKAKGVEDFKEVIQERQDEVLIFLFYLGALFENIEKDGRVLELFLKGRKPEHKEFWGSLLQDKELGDLLKRCSFDEARKGEPVGLKLKGRVSESEEMLKGFLEKTDDWRAVGRRVQKKEGGYKVIWDTQSLVFQDERVRKAWDLFVDELTDYMACPIVLVRGLWEREYAKIYLSQGLDLLIELLVKTLLCLWLKRVGVFDDKRYPKIRKDLENLYARIVHKALASYKTSRIKSKAGWWAYGELKRSSEETAYGVLSQVFNQSYLTEPFLTCYLTWRGEEARIEGDVLKIPKLVFSFAELERITAEKAKEERKYIPLPDVERKLAKEGYVLLDQEELSSETPLETPQKKPDVKSFLKLWIEVVAQKLQDDWLFSYPDKSSFYHDWIAPSLPNEEALWWHLYRHERETLGLLRTALESAGNIPPDILSNIKEILNHGTYFLLFRNLKGLIATAYLESPKTRAKNKKNALRTIEVFFKKKARENLLQNLSFCLQFVEKHSLSPVKRPRKARTLIKPNVAELLPKIKTVSFPEDEIVWLPPQEIPRYKPQDKNWDEKNWQEKIRSLLLTLLHS